MNDMAFGHGLEASIDLSRGEVGNGYSTTKGRMSTNTGCFKVLNVFQNK